LSEGALIAVVLESCSWILVVVSFQLCVFASPYDIAVSGFVKQTPIAIINVVQNMDLLFMQSSLNASIKYLLHIRLFKVEDEVFKDDSVGI